MDSMTKIEYEGHWIKTKEQRPEPGQEVIVARPNQYSGKTDFLIARFHAKSPGGTTYGKSYAPKVLFDDYWSLPAIVPLDNCPYWTHVPVLAEDILKAK